MRMEMRIRAYAKLNLGLRVLGRRPDGYHELRTLMQTIDLADELSLSLEPGAGAEAHPRTRKAPKIEIELKVEPQGQFELRVPPEENLAWRAASLICGDYEREDEREPAGETELESKLKLKLKLMKRIPPGAGLAGGSSDAAAVLAGVNELLKLGLSREELAELGARLGSDVSFFLWGGTCLAEGRGEQLVKLPPLPRYSILVVVPPFALSTAEVYRKFDELQEQERGLLRSSSGSKERRREREKEIGGEKGHLRNDLEAAAVALRPELREYREFLARAEPRPRFWGMSGSGPSWFAAFTERAQAERFHQESGRLPGELFLVEPCGRGWELVDDPDGSE